MDTQTERLQQAVQSLINTKEDLHSIDATLAIRKGIVSIVSDEFLWKLFSEETFAAIGISTSTAVRMRNAFSYELLSNENVTLPTKLSDLDYTTCTVRLFLEIATVGDLMRIRNFGKRYLRILNRLLEYRGYPPVPY